MTACFLAGLALGSYLPYVPTTVLFLLVIAGIILTSLERQQRLTPSHGMLLYGSLLAGLLYWTAFTWSSTDRNLLERAGHDPIRIVGTIVEPARHAPRRTVLVVSISRLGQGHDAQSVEGRLRLTWREPDRTFGQGDQVQLTTKIRAPSGTVNPGGFDYAAYLERQGIDAVASVSGPGQITLLSSGLTRLRWAPRHIIDEWRERIRQAAVATLDGSALSLYLSLIIGERGYLSPEIRDNFMATGTVHILSISGSHLGLIAFLSFFLVKAICRCLPVIWFEALSRRITPTRLAASVTIAPVTFYAVLAGAEVATVRSLVMILLFLLAVWLGRAQQLLLVLAAAALLILVHDPRALFDISFQLSYVSVLAIALILNWRSRQEQNGPSLPDPKSWAGGRWFSQYVWITGGVTLVTIPLVAYYFNQIAWLGLATNFVVIPLAGFVLVPLGLGSAIWLLVFGGDSLPAGQLNQALLGWLADAMRLLARVPGAEWHIASPAIPAIVIFYVLLFTAIRPEGKTMLRWGSALSAVLLLGWWSWSPRSLSDGETLQVMFLDVGQGDASLIELPDGQTVLIDAGAVYDTLDMGRAVVGPYLWDRGIRRLDHVIGTHPQLDHVGGLAWVLRSFQIGQYWGNGIARDEPFYQRVQDAIREGGLVERTAAEGQAVFDSGPCRLTILNPPARHSLKKPFTQNVRSGSLLNNLSIVTRLDCGPHSFLFTADIEVEAIARLSEATRAARARVLKVPHHGARSSLDSHWIEQMGVEAAVISVGSHNPYGHPAAAVLAAYEKEGVRLWRTDLQGAIQVIAKLSSADIEIRAARDSLPRPARIGPSMLVSERLNMARLWSQWMGP
ncbi:MAG TPA: DNA internalization-related competence protein ComEC/Rec2 [Nitrospiraceae bacterium]|nr:DNA internalization-related competence protein ComEC/Rec2 [Nitrospiraceae bacterium]